MFKKLTLKFDLWWYTQMMKEEIEELEILATTKNNRTIVPSPARYTQEFMSRIYEYDMVNHRLAREFTITKAKQNKLALEAQEQVMNNTKIWQQKQMELLPERINALEKELAEVKKMLEEKEMI